MRSLSDIQTDRKEISLKKKETEQKNILFISHEMDYTGAPRSLLRMCRVARKLGYGVTVWSMRPGPFCSEYEAAGFDVEIVPIEKTVWPETAARVEAFDLAVCNTVITYAFARLCSQRIPTVWYIREAANVREVLPDSPDMAYVLKHSRDICCLSEYAAEALRAYTKESVRVIHNCVEDESKLALPYTPGQGEKVKFAQFGALEKRKGCDVLLDAFLTMPEEYRARAELYFAGGVPQGGEELAAAVICESAASAGVHYLGTITDARERIETLSQMDVIVVASRDEACSLVALEGAMLSRALLVTENVGAKYRVSEENGFVVPAADVSALRRAMMDCIERQDELAEMGKASRRAYETGADMGKYTREMKALFARAEEKGSRSFEKERRRNIRVFSAGRMKVYRKLTRRFK